jgi:predicted membrane protein
MRTLLKSIKYKLQLFDGLWSIPLAFLAFVYFGYISTVYFGDPLISIEYLQQVLLAGLILVFANFVAFLGGYFNFRGLQKYFYSQEIKVETKNKLTAWQRIKLYLWVYFGLLSSFLVILWLVMTATA